MSATLFLTSSPDQEFHLTIHVLVQKTFRLAITFKTDPQSKSQDNLKLTTSIVFTRVTFIEVAVHDQDY